MRPALTLLLLPLLAAGCASRAAFVHTRPGVTAEQLFADTDVCTAVSKGQRVPGVVTPPPVTGGAAAQAGAAFGGGFAQGLAQGRAQVAAYEACMAERGYVMTQPTEAERKAFRALKTEAERKAWLAEFAARERPAPSEAP